MTEMIGLSWSGTGDLFENATYRYIDLAIDNRLPALAFGELVYGRYPIPLVDDWLISDRPPLQTGLMLLFSGAVSTSISERIGSEFALSIFAQSLFFVGTISLLYSLAIPKRFHAFVLLVTSVSGVVIVNSFFTWPKLFGTGVALAAIAALVEIVRSDEQKFWRYFICGALVAFSLLTHTSHAFAMIGLILTMCLYILRSQERRRNLISFFSVLMVTGVIYLTWVIFQRTFDPPGDRLAKWHFAGIKEITPIGTIPSILEQYEKLTFFQWIGYKVQNFERLIFPVWDKGDFSLTSQTNSNSKLVSPWNFGESFSDYWITAGEVVLLVAIMPAIYWGLINLVYRRFHSPSDGITPQLKKFNVSALYSLIFGVFMWAILIFLPGTTYVFHGSLIFAVLPIIILAVLSAIELPSVICGIGLTAQLLGTLGIYWISKPISWAMSHSFEPVSFGLAALCLGILVPLALRLLSYEKELDRNISAH